MQKGSEALNETTPFINDGVRDARWNALLVDAYSLELRRREHPGIVEEHDWFERFGPESDDKTVLAIGGNGYTKNSLTVEQADKIEKELKIGDALMRDWVVKQKDLVSRALQKLDREERAALESYFRGP